MNEFILPHGSNLPYTGSVPMEPQKDDKKKDGEKKADEITAAEAVVQKRLRDEWERINRERERRGEKLTKNEKQKQEELIKNGKKPETIRDVLSGDQAAAINPQNAREVLEKISQEVFDQITAGAIGEKDIKGEEEFILQWVRKAGLPPDQTDTWVERMNAIAAENAKQVAAVAERLDKIKKIHEKRQRGEKLTEEERKIYAEAIINRELPGIGGGADVPENEQTTTDQDALREQAREEMKAQGASEQEVERVVNSIAGEGDQQAQQQVEEPQARRAEAMGQNGAEGLPLTQRELRVQTYMNKGDSKEIAEKKVDQENLNHSYNPVEHLKEIVKGLSDTPPEGVSVEEHRQKIANRIKPDGDIGRDAIAFLGLTTGGRRGPSPSAAIESEDALKRKLEDIAGSSTVKEMAKRLVEEGLNPISRDVDKRSRESRGFEPYENINEIANDIMIQSGGEFARDGKYALIRTENGKEVFQQENFLRWVRARMYEYHDSDTDNEVDMFQRINVIGGARSTTISDMIFTHSMFTDREGRYLQALHDQIYYELWLFNTSRDVDAIYRKVMGDDEKLPETLNAIYARNTFTKESTMDTILRLPNASGNGSINFKDGDAVRENQDTGKALRRALLMYYHIADKDMLNKLASKDSAFFDNNKFIELYVKGRRELEENKDKTDEELRKEAEGKINTEGTNGTFDLFKDGKINNEKTFIDRINPFNQAQKPLNLLNEAKERVRLLIMDAEKISYEEARYAETFAFSMMRWSGGAAHNDTSNVGYDSWTKVLEADMYRRRGLRDTSGSITGNIYSLGGLKRLGVDFFTGARVLQDPKDPKATAKSLLEVIQGGQGDMVDLSKIEAVRFGQPYMSFFGSDHITRSFKLFHTLVESQEFNFDKFLTVDPWGRVVFDAKAASEWRDGPLKAFRYAYSTWPGTDYSKLIRARVPRKVNGQYVEGEYDMKTMTVAEALWGRQVYDDFVKERRGTVTYKDANGKTHTRPQTVGEVIMSRDKDGVQNRNVFWKRPLMYTIAAEIRAHRDRESGYRMYKTEEVERIYQWLESFSGQIEWDERDMTKTQRIGRFFTKEEIEWIRKASGTGKAKMYFNEYGSALGNGVLVGLWQSLGTLVGSLDKTA